MRIPMGEVNQYFVAEDAMETARLAFVDATRDLENNFPWLVNLDAVVKTDVLVAFHTRLP